MCSMIHAYFNLNVKMNEVSELKSFTCLTIKTKTSNLCEFESAPSTAAAAAD